MTRVSLIDMIRYYRALPHQTAAINELQRVIDAENPEILTRVSAWYDLWKADPTPKDYARAKDLIKKFEGCHLNAYICPAGVTTIGWGTTRYPGGVRVKMGDSISQARADELLNLEIDRIARLLEESIPYWDEMNNNQRSALISFAYNLGAYFYNTSGFRTISRMLKGKHWQEVPNAMLLYRNPGSHFEAGLRRRRIEEGTIWSTNVDNPR